MSEETAHADVLESLFSEAAKPNRQLYENSVLCGSPVELDYESDSQRLYNSKPPNLAILSEKPEHRLIIYLKAQGLSNREIAHRMEKTESWVSQILRQPWARARLVRELHEAGQDAVQTVIKAAALDSVFTLIDQRDNEKARPSERITAANSLLDRLLGKPTQHIEQKSVISRGIDEIEQLKRDLVTLEAEQIRLTGGLPAGAVQEPANPVSKETDGS